LLEALIVVVRAASKPGALLVQAGTAVPEPKGLAAPGAVAHLAQLGWLALLHAGPEGGVLGITLEVKVFAALGRETVLGGFGQRALRGFGRR